MLPEVDVDGQNGVTLVFVFANVVDDALKSCGCAGVWSKSILGRGDQVVFKKMRHNLGVYEAVKYFGNYWEERDRSIV